MTPMSDDHKAALKAGRQQGSSVRAYMDALEEHRPRRGRKRTPESIQKRLDAVEAQLQDARSLSRVHLIQERLDLQKELETKKKPVDLSALEAEFVQAAAEYGRRKGITYSAWREAGVDAAVLKKAGIRRSE
ncbi:MAG TPA: hypothetical protein VM030_09585 [Acidimicrobiales bacterium]|nr:hypothetical protein [Acidimicrobiales bacterium]